ncbi:MAG: PqqD family peptide modification chaperone [Desulfobacterales bacterium]|nr:PqqD family peptide modification chaperone [Desulfobacterales bacterium]
MLDRTRKYPRLVKGVKLVHPEGTDQYFMYKSGTGERFELNKVAFEMFIRMDGSRDIDKICLDIQTNFKEANEARNDLEILIKEAVCEGCLELLHDSNEKKIINEKKGGEKNAAI